jgi:hypothetical protein
MSFTMSRSIIYTTLWLTLMNVALAQAPTSTANYAPLITGSTSPDGAGVSSEVPDGGAGSLVGDGNAEGASGSGSSGISLSTGGEIALIACSVGAAVIGSKFNIHLASVISLTNKSKWPLHYTGSISRNDKSSLLMLSRSLQEG